MQTQSQLILPCDDNQSSPSPDQLRAQFTFPPVISTSGALNCIFPFTNSLPDPRPQSQRPVNSKALVSQYLGGIPVNQRSSKSVYLARRDHLREKLEKKRSREAKPAIAYGTFNGNNHGNGFHQDQMEDIEQVMERFGEQRLSEKGARSKPKDKRVKKKGLFRSSSVKDDDHVPLESVVVTVPGNNEQIEEHFADHSSSLSEEGLSGVRGTTTFNATGGADMSDVLSGASSVLTIDCSSTEPAPPAANSSGGAGAKSDEMDFERGGHRRQGYGGKSFQSTGDDEYEAEEEDEDDQSSSRTTGDGEYSSPVTTADDADESPCSTTANDANRNSLRAPTANCAIECHFTPVTNKKAKKTTAQAPASATLTTAASATQHEVVKVVDGPEKLQKSDSVPSQQKPSERHYHRSRFRPMPTTSATLADYLPTSALVASASSAPQPAVSAAHQPSAVPCSAAAAAAGNLLDDDQSPPLIPSSMSNFTPLPPPVSSPRRATYANVLGDKSPQRHRQPDAKRPTTKPPQVPLPGDSTLLKPSVVHKAPPSSDAILPSTLLTTTAVAASSSAPTPVDVVPKKLSVSQLFGNQHQKASASLVTVEFLDNPSNAPHPSSDAAADLSLAALLQEVTFGCFEPDTNSGESEETLAAGAANNEPYKLTLAEVEKRTGAAVRAPEAPPRKLTVAQSRMTDFVQGEWKKFVSNPNVIYYSTK